jgi:hypothetical protein
MALLSAVAPWVALARYYKDPGLFYEPCIVVDSSGPSAGGFILAALPTLPYLYVLFRTKPWGQPKDRGLVLAVALGMAGLFICGLLMLLGARAAIAIALVQVVMMLSVVKVYRALRPGTTYREILWEKAIVPLCGFVALFLIVGAAADTAIERGSVGVLSAVPGALRTIDTSEVTYSSTYPTGFSATLAQLGPPSNAGAPSTAEAAGLVDHNLASGKRYGYTYTYKPGPGDAKGMTTSYSVTARAIDRRCGGSFYTDESGVIRHTDEDRDATAKDSPINW